MPDQPYTGACIKISGPPVNWDDKEEEGAHEDLIDEIEDELKLGLNAVVSRLKEKHPALTFRIILDGP